MTDEQLQFAISQYIDGLLPQAEAAALEQRLAADPVARRMLEEYRRLNGLLSSSLPLPEVDWDAFSARISEHVDRGEIIPLQPAVWNWRYLAVAASLLLAATLWLVISSQFQAPTDQLAGKGVSGGGKGATLQVALVVPSPSEGPALAQINIGPSAALHLAETTALYPRDLTASRPPSLSIAGVPRRDEDLIALQ